ncbi:MAG: radical SAM protein, partial [Ketobacter sp.]|nr:radical SAM protein [Ketobacter sp.]
MHKILPLLNATHFPSLRRGATTTLQVNLGYQCNQRCIHCHVNAGPHRTEMMSADTVRLIVPAMQAAGMTTLDLTGGAPEMHP